MKYSEKRRVEIFRVLSELIIGISHNDNNCRLYDGVFSLNTSCDNFFKKYQKFSEGQTELDALKRIPTNGHNKVCMRRRTPLVPGNF